MKNSQYDPYLYKPDTNYLSTSTRSSQSTSSDRPLSKREQSSTEEVFQASNLKKFFRNTPGWLYFQLEYQVVSILVVSAFIVIYLLFSYKKFW